MSSVLRFEDLIAWQKARLMIKEIYGITRNGEFARDFDLVRQIRRAAVSVISNIAEGFERTHRGEFEHFLLTAKGSCAEVRTQLYVAPDVGYLDQPTFDRLMAMSEEVARVIGGLRNSVERQRQGRP